MQSIVAVNGSPQMDRGHTSLILAAFLDGAASAGASVELLYPSRIKPKPCGCGTTG